MAGCLERADSGIVVQKQQVMTNMPETAEQRTSESSQCHPLVNVVSEQVESYILQNWDFEHDEQGKETFVKRRISGLGCLYFPQALDERIGTVSKLVSILYLLGEVIGGLDAVDGEELVEALESAVKGHWLPTDDVPAVWMLCEVFDEMRAQDYVLVDDIVETSLAHLRAMLIRRGRTTRREDSLQPNKPARPGAALFSALSLFASGVSEF